MLDRKIRYCSLPEAIREQFLWGARSIVIAGTHGKTTTTSLTGWLLDRMAALDPSVLVGGIARNFGEQGSSYRLGPRPRVRHRGRRVRQRLLRQDREVPEVPAGHRRHQQRRVRSRRHLRRPRRGPPRVPPPRQPGAAQRAAAARRGQPGRGGAEDAARVAGRDVRPGRAAPTGRRTTSTVADGGDAVSSVAARRLAVRRRVRSCRCSACTTCATRWRRSPSARTLGHAAPSTLAEGLRRFAGVKRRLEIVGDARAASRSTTTSRTIRPRSPRRFAALRAGAPGPADLGRLRAALRLVVPPRVPGRLRAGVRARPTKWCSRRCSDRRCRRTERLSVDQLVADLQRRGRRAAPRRHRSTTSSTTIVQRARAPATSCVVMSNGGFGGIHRKLLQALRSAGERLASATAAHAHAMRSATRRCSSSTSRSIAAVNARVHRAQRARAGSARCRACATWCRRTRRSPCTSIRCTDVDAARRSTRRDRAMLPAG